MTFNQTAEIFARRWGKDVNRTHVASIMRLREKASQNANQNSNQLALGASGSMTFRKVGGAKASPLSLGSFGSGQSPPSLLPQSTAQSHLAAYQNPQIGQKRSLPMSGLDLFNMNNLESPARNSPTIHSGLPSATVTTLNTSSSSSSPGSLVKAERGVSPVSVITPNVFKREKPDDECFDVTSFDESKKTKIQCERCPSTFPSQAALFQHILTAPGHRDNNEPN